MDTKAYLAKFGWSEGKGLGKNEDGIKTYLRVNKKADNAGVGRHQGGSFVPWWERAFNAAAAGTAPPACVPVLRMGDTGPGFKARPSSREIREEEEDDGEVPGVTTAEMFEACGNRTGKKADMSGKLSRIEAQEARARAAAASAASGAAGSTLTVTPGVGLGASKPAKDKASKKAKAVEVEVEVEAEVEAEEKEKEVEAEVADDASERKKRKKKERREREAEAEQQQEPEEEQSEASEERKERRRKRQRTSP
eukprot:m51a1_g11600 hypothetical protein (252) ;mRNA; r:127910-128791